MKRAAIYARFSSDKQTEDSIEAQLRACREYAAAHGFNIAGVYTDEGISGKGSKTFLRRQYARLLRDCEKGMFDVVLIHKYDRIARNLGEHVNLEAKLSRLDVQLIAAAQDFGDSKEAKIMRALVWSMSEYYIDNLAEETKKGLRETALRAEHTGGYPPFGYDVVEQKYVINPLEAGFVKMIFDAAQARAGFRDIIARLDAAGIRGKRGRPIKYPQIYEMLRNEKYTGVYLYSTTEQKRRVDRRTKPDAIRIENAFPAIISPEQFKEVQRIMSEHKQTGNRNTYLCSGLVYCRCGAKMHAMTSKRKGHEYKYFVCSKKCGAPTVKAEEVDDAARRYLRELLSDENQLTIASAIKAYQAGAGQRMDEFKGALKKRIGEKQREYDALMQNLASGALPEEIAADVGKRMKELKGEIATLENTTPPEDFTAVTIKGWLDTLKNSPDAAAVRLLIERIDADQQENEKTAFNIQSTLNTVLGLNGCGGSQPWLPEILFRFYCESV